MRPQTTAFLLGLAPFACNFEPSPEEASGTVNTGGDAGNAATPDGARAGVEAGTTTGDASRGADAKSVAEAGSDAADFPVVGPVLYVDATIPAASCTTYSALTRACGSGNATAYRNIAGAAAAARPGDNVVIRGGTFTEPLVVPQSGTADKPITYRNYNAETVVIQGDLTPAIDISGREYVVLHGLSVSKVVRFMYARKANHNTIQNCAFAEAQDSGGSAKTGLFFEEAIGNRIVGNTIDDTTADSLSLVASDDNIIEGNSFRKAAHTLWTIKCGNRNVLRNNYFHNELQKIGEIYDCDGVGFDHQITRANATKGNLVEGNTFAFVPSSGDASPFAGIQYAAQDGIIRNNIFFDHVGPALDLTLYGGEAAFNTNNHVYANVFARSSFAGVSIAGSGGSMQGNVLKNNVLAASVFVASDTRWSWYTGELAGKPVQIMTGRLDGFVFEGNNIFGGGADVPYTVTFGDRTSNSNPPQHPLSFWQTNHPALFVGNVEVAPSFVNDVAHDYHLATGSALIDAGVFLTRVALPSGGTTLTVADTGYFFAGSAVTADLGDEIQLEGATATARVLGVDAQARTLTLDQPLQATTGQGVALRYSGARPDIGAFER